MEDTKLIAKKRDLDGSSNARRMRKTGALPGVIYGDEKEPTSIQLNAHDFEQLLHHHASESLIVDIELEGEGDVSVLVKEVQHHPVTSDLVHVDLLRVAANKPIQVEVPLELTGEAAGVKAGGTLDHTMHFIAVECLPADLVEAIEADVSALEIGQALHVSDLVIPGSLKLLVDGAGIVASVAGPRAEEEEEVEEEAGSAEPEVISEKKEEEAE
jgi:large subunit ribosomal protein L25